MMSPEEWALVEDVYSCVLMLCEERLGIPLDDETSTPRQRRDALQARLKAEFSAAKQSRIIVVAREDALIKRIADLERELEEAKAKLPRQIRVAD